MRFKKSLGLLTIATITTVPIAAVISCGAEAKPLSMVGAVISEDSATADSLKVNPFKINSLPFSDGTNLFPNKAALDAFRDRLFNKYLYFGPEAWDLKSITLDPGHITSGSQLGVYYPASKQIFINISDLRGVPIDQAEDVMAKVIAHEYGHHFFATYANGYRSKGTIDPAVKNSDNYVYDNTGDARYVAPWNEKYFETFVKDYNMNDDKYAAPVSYQENNINAVFSLKDLFDNSNKKGAALDWGDHSEVTYGTSKTASGSAARYAVSVPKENEGSLRYIYSMDEQVTRKMQMMFYPGEIKTGRYSFDSSLLKVSEGKSSFFDPYVVDWMRTADLYNDGTKINKAPIYNDDIFANGKEDEAYQSLLGLMGYGKQISHMYSKNTAKVSDAESVVGLSSSNDNHVRISGYVDPAKNFVAIVDKNKKVIANMFVSTKLDERFKFAHKAKWDSTFADSLIGPTTDTSKVSYITDEFYVGSLKGQQLFFLDKSNNLTPITNINDYGGHSNVNSYDSQRPYNDQYYKLLKVGSKVEVEGYL